jgi:hypothetical protein
MTATSVALTTLLVAGQSLVGLDDCYSHLEVAPAIPGCCAHEEEAPAVEDVHQSCCKTPFIADQGLSSTTTSTPDIGSASLSLTAAVVDGFLASLGPHPSGFRPILERPPDRAPPTSVTVLLI